jgi:hypothetical protein
VLSPGERHIAQHNPHYRADKVFDDYRPNKCACQLSITYFDLFGEEERVTNVFNFVFTRWEPLVSREL